MFALVDANSFYCSAEQVFRPEWRGKPLIVLSNNDGCIVAANKQATALGIQKFQPFFKAQALCEKAEIIVCSSNYELYADLSHKMMQVIAGFAPVQHIYSIDECFLDFADCRKSIPDLLEHVQLLRKTVWKETRLPVCVGLGKTLTLAKTANHVAKKWPGFHGTCLLESGAFKEQVFEKLAPVDVWGIGRKTSAKLQEFGIDTVKKLTALPVNHLPAGFSVELQRTIRELNGEACQTWDSARSDKLQIFSTRSMGQRITNIENLNQALVKHTCIAAAKARQQQSLCGTLTAFAAGSPFDIQPRSFKIIKHFNPPTNNSTQLIKAVSESIEQLFQSGAAYYKVGVGLLNLSSEQHQQWDLFSAAQENSALMQVVDKINQRYGSDKTFFAAQGINEKWAMRRRFLTPQYTTKWPDIPNISC
ncbi:Y-family DNA polymerase [Psychromonas ossibalaenae]|uniref:Y-family DNA polymerase n=1 Tax=Psychromonas ossibalaenae TaxID=444922 RepID=UPI000373AA1C|nr:Y-family DNA polymerase [Psychromonas ossibalaenae]